MISMARLKDCFEELGYQNVRTYINSGNVIFKAAPTDPRKLEKMIEKVLLAIFDQPLKVVVRSITEMEQVIRAIPKSWITSTDKKCNVIFLRHEINQTELVAQLIPKPGIEELTYHTGTLFWAANTSDLTQSSMIKLSKQGVYQQMTVRNLNTTRKVYQVMVEIK